MYILTDDWVTIFKHNLFDEFANYSDKDKRIVHFIDGVQLPHHSMIKIYQKEKNVVVAFREIQWKFCKNKFFTKTVFDTLATVTPTRVYSSDLHKAGMYLCAYLGFNCNRHMNKVLFRSILKKGEQGYEEYIQKYPRSTLFRESDAKIFTDDCKLFGERVRENQELYDLLHQAIILDRRIKMSWSDRKIHDIHRKWTEEIHILKYRNCTSDSIWENIPKLPDYVELLNSERRIADEGANMHHCIYANYGNYLKNKTKVAFHVNTEDPFTVMFDIRHDGEITFNQAYHAWNKALTDEEKELAKGLMVYVATIKDINKIEEQDIPDLLNLF
jgi:hypothetical protein